MIIEIAIENDRISDPEVRKSILEQLPYVCPEYSNASFEGPGLKVWLKDGAAPDHATIEQTIRDYVETVLKSFRRVKPDIFHQNAGDLTAASTEPLDHLLATGQMRELAPGSFLLRGTLRQAIEGLDARFRDYAVGRGAREESYPTTLPTSSFVENGYLTSFPHHALFVAAVHESKESIDELVAHVRPRPQELDESHAKFGPHAEMLAPTVCYHTFEGLRDDQLDQLPMEITARNPCHRFESRNIRGLERLRTFTMREIVFFGTQADCERIRQEIMGDFIAWFDAWGVTYRVISASDPFFATSASGKRAYQGAMRLKFEAQCLLPHLDKWLSVASFNLHQQTLVGAYDIGSNTPDPLASGCVGYGYERMAYALFAQFGDDPAKWPGELGQIAGGPERPDH
ncbi:aminoacyl--tRNA ligase-related protein [Roseospirillum parvum]|uniref:tRNA synthetase class II core domain (G, H, P, S and T) n=1 Tax=Roseospirillum parvum TaxID=83401 RepID=A0A1G7UZC6_9PROT|nr:aminoacyl--tRNA ligase-related protein [Roseospirillum parvum]SDG52912.1 tRNA synthetase class II core domain (G, H, P, S and T) [Roseospirillum parvum]